MLREIGDYESIVLLIPAYNKSKITTHQTTGRCLNANSMGQAAGLKTVLGWADHKANAS